MRQHEKRIEANSSSPLSRKRRRSGNFIGNRVGHFGSNNTNKSRLAVFLLSFLLLPSAVLVVVSSVDSPPTNSNINIPPEKEKRRERISSPQLSTTQQAAGRASLPNNNINNHHNGNNRKNQEFLDWCRHVLGIETILEIQTFDYYDYMRALNIENDDHNNIPNVEIDLPMIPVRGLAASRDIAKGEVVIRIPLQALFSVFTTNIIDQDPVLNAIMGPEARRKHGWGAESSSSLPESSKSEDEAAALGYDGDDARGNANALSFSLVEIPLLAVAILHHKRLGSASPLAPYIKVLEQTPVDRMPFLWSQQRLRQEVSEGIRTVARGMQKEMQEMYKTVVQVLIDEHPEQMGKDNVDATTGEWMFSYEQFQWAFAIVNSRHWQLPIADLEEQQRQKRNSADSNNDNKPKKPTPPKLQHHHHQALLEEADGQLPPADMPTDEFVRNEQEDDEIREPDQQNQEQQQQQKNRHQHPPASHSFLAPVADLMNFGPPCTRGSYNEETHTFDMIATCSFSKGQEVTFWYSDECNHIMVGVYGFTHPLVPVCPTAEEYRQKSQEWHNRALSLERQLDQADADLDDLENENQRLYDILSHCDCCRDWMEKYKRQDENAGSAAASASSHNNNEGEGSRLRHEHVRGGVFSSGGGSSGGGSHHEKDRRGEDIDRRGVRKMRRDRNSEF